MTHVFHNAYSHEAGTNDKFPLLLNLVIFVSQNYLPYQRSRMYDFGVMNPESVEHIGIMDIQKETVGMINSLLPKFRDWYWSSRTNRASQIELTQFDCFFPPYETNVKLCHYKIKDNGFKMSNFYQSILGGATENLASLSK